MKKNFVSPDYQMVLLKCRTTLVKDKRKYFVIEKLTYPSLSLYRAMFIATREGGIGNYVGRSIIEQQEKFTHPYNGNMVWGIGEIYHSTFSICMIAPREKFNQTISDYDGFGSIGIYPKTTGYTSKVDIKQIKSFIEILMGMYKNKEMWESNKLRESWNWGAISSVPKGFKHIKAGKVKLGDYYWDKDGFTRCDVSFSSAKPGTVIKADSIKVIEESGKSYRIRFYDNFIIRRQK